MIKIFNDSMRKFQLRVGSETITISPGKFLDVDESVQEDITFRMAVAGGDLKVYDKVEAAEQLIRNHAERPAEEPEVPVTVETAGTKRTARKSK